MQDYKQLKVWEKAHEFTVMIYKHTSGFPKEEVYSLTNQLRRASFSIPANIAEGCGKNTQPELAHFLNIALGSANEVEYFLLLAKDLKHQSVDVYEELAGKINEIRAMLISLISKVRATPKLKT